MQVRKSSFFADTIKNHTNLISKLEEFLRTKEKDPTQPFGKDTAFISAGPIGRTGLKLKHAHLTQDVSVVYRIHGKNPHVIDLYGIFRHKDLGTSNTANIKTQQKLAKKFKNEPIDSR
jgi:hypothetical protein